jgi:hypothetical protein
VRELFRELLGFNQLWAVAQKLVAGAGDSSGTERKENVFCWKPLQSIGSKSVTVDTSVCVCVCVCVCACVCV